MCGRDALWLRFTTGQPAYSLLVRGIDADVLPVAEQFGMCVAVVAGSPI
jgi:aryl-alcohol dehydrogenase-like predicted oxidoreductase